MRIEPPGTSTAPALAVILAHFTPPFTGTYTVAYIDMASGTMKSMMAAPAGPPPLTEGEYWRDYDIIRNDVNAAMVSCYTHRAINDVAVADRKILQRLNRQPDFWRVTSFSLQNSLFIVLARILDSDPNLHSIYQILNATSAHPEFFSKAALRARKLAIPGTEPNPPWLDEYVQKAWEPTVQDLRALKRALRPHKTKFDDIYKPIRNQIAHIIFKEDQAITDLYSRTLKADIDEILCFLHSLIRAIWNMAYNAAQPNLDSRLSVPVKQGTKQGVRGHLFELNSTF